MSAIREAVGRIAHSEKVVHLVWLLVLLLVETGGVIAGGSGTSGP
jgi:hypothetical protein